MTYHVKNASGNNFDLHTRGKNHYLATRWIFQPTTLWERWKIEQLSRAVTTGTNCCLLCDDVYRLNVLEYPPVTYITHTHTQKTVTSWSMLVLIYRPRRMKGLLRAERRSDGTATLHAMMSATTLNSRLSRTTERCRLSDHRTTEEDYPHSHLSLRRSFCN